MVDRELTGAEAEFVGRFHQENRPPSEKSKQEERKAVKSHRLTLAYYWLLGLIVLAPFALSGLLLYSLGRFESLLGDDSLRFIKENFSEDQIEVLGENTGVGQLSTAVDLYDQRGTIVAGIFTVFVILFALVVGLRILIRSRRSTP